MYGIIALLLLLLLFYWTHIVIAIALINRKVWLWWHKTGWKGSVVFAVICFVPKAFFLVSSGSQEIIEAHPISYFFANLSQSPEMFPVKLILGFIPYVRSMSLAVYFAIDLFMFFAAFSLLFMGKQRLMKPESRNQ